MTSEEIVKQLPNEMAACLLGDRYFSDLTVAVAQTGDVAAEIARKQAAIKAKNGKAGAGVIALEISADDLVTNLRFGPMRLYPSFQVWEQPELNRGQNGTGKWSISIARRIQRVVKVAGLGGIVKSMECATPCITPLGRLKEGFAENLIGHQVDFQCIEWTDEEWDQVAIPAFVQADGAMTMTSATAEAEIWFTTDGSAVVPGWGAQAGVASAARLYAGPVDLTGVSVVRAAAFKDGMVPSWTQMADI